MVDIFGMFRRRLPSRRLRGFARDRMDIGSLGDRMDDVLNQPLREAPPLASTLEAPPLAPPVVTPAPSRARQAPKPSVRTAPAPKSAARAGYLAAHNVEKSFGSRRVVHDVSIYVRRGEAVGLLGPNGAGK